jgi:hypothetical protein
VAGRPVTTKDKDTKTTREILDDLRAVETIGVLGTKTDCRTRIRVDCSLDRVPILMRRLSARR